LDVDQLVELNGLFVDFINMLHGLSDLVLVFIEGNQLIELGRPI